MRMIALAVESRTSRNIVVEKDYTGTPAECSKKFKKELKENGLVAIKIYNEMHYKKAMEVVSK